MKANDLQSRYWTIWCVVLAMGCAIRLSAARGQSGGPYDLSWNTIDSGGAMDSSGGSFSLSGTAGQPDAEAPPVMSGGAFELTGGFWPIAQVCHCLGDMNGDGRKDGRDVQMFVQCQTGGGSCSCADVDGAGGVTIDDVEVFVAGLMAGDTCP